MSFGDAVTNINKKLEKTFEKNADKAVNDPDDGSQADHDARQAGNDAANSASDAANEEAKNHDPEWKAIKDLSDKAIGAETKAVATAKIGFLKFVGIVTAIFTAVMTFSYIHPDESTVQSRKMLAIVQREQEDQARIQRLTDIMVNQEEFNTMVGGLFVQSAPTPTETSAPVAAAALPPPIAAIAAEPAKIELTTESGSTVEVTTTVGQVYANSPSPVRREMERPSTRPPPPQKPELGITEDPNSCFVKHCLSSENQHKSFTVDSGFARVSVSY
jgi:hypothetical protein